MDNFTLNTHHAYLNNDIVFKSNGSVSIVDKVTGKEYHFTDELKTRFCAGRHVFACDNQEEEVFIEDAIKLGGGRIKNAFVFDNSPWILVTTKDRLYITHRETKEEKIEYNITPDSINDLGYTNEYVNEDGQFHWRMKPCEFFLFQTKNDYAIYDVLHGKIVFSFVNHIYSNNHLVIYKAKDCIEVYDYRQKRVVASFNGQYSFGNKFYFVKERKLYGLNTSSSFINAIDFVGEIGEEDVLMGNCLLKLEMDYSEKKEYSFFWLGNGENNMNKTKLIFPYYIENWKGENTKSFQRSKDLYNKFKEENKGLLSDNSCVKSMCIGLRINRTLYEWESHSHMITLYGEIVAYPALTHAIPFKLKGKEGETLDYKDATIEQMPMIQNDIEAVVTDTIFELNVGEKELGKSSSGNLIITKEDSKLFLRNISENSREEILSNGFDSSNYTNAYFTSDGKSVVLQINNNEGKILGFEDLNMTHFDVEGFTVARNEGFNGYKPEIAIVDGRKPVWRDPISLARILEKDMSKHVFMSPDGKYFANTNMKTVLYNCLSKSEILSNERMELEKIYNWSSLTEEEEKKKIIEVRKQLLEQKGKDVLFEKIKYCDNERELDNVIAWWVNNESCFTKLFIDKLDYVCYKATNSTETRQILIGRNAYFLNYVSFSYDSNYLSFAAKMMNDDFRFTQEGVFVLYDLNKEEIVTRIENYNDQQLWAVWMTMFSKKGDVAFYDSHANAYLLRHTDYSNITEAPGKSLLCFSPSGKYVACSDQRYIDYAHHPNENWGHQPSGNVYIHSTDCFEHSIEQYNDLGDGIEGVACQAGSVSSAAFSQDERRLLVVGNDGVVVVRNLKFAGKEE